MKYKRALALLTVILALFSFLFYRNIAKEHRTGQDTEKTASPESPITGYRLTDTEGKIADVVNKIDQLIPNVTFTHVDNTTCANKIRVRIVNPKEKYCVGDNLTVQLDACDYSGNRKKHGGDFLRARMYSPALGAGASGKIEDLNNGSYRIYFTLFWEGRVHVSLLLIHPSEAVSGLWRARNSGFENIYFIGTFISGTKEVQTECNFKSNTDEGMCLHRAKMGELFYCMKPEHLACETLINMQSYNRKHSYLSHMEQQLLERSDIGVEIPKPFEYIDVFHCNKRENVLKEKCTVGMESPFPSGYFFKNSWNPIFCSMTTFKTMDQKTSCLKGKMVYLMGDSTLRQWILHCTAVMNSLKYFDQHRTGLETKLVALDMERNILIHWKRHAYPYIAYRFYTVKDEAYIAHEIDRLGGGQHTIIVINLGQHFRPFPIAVFIRRVMDVRRAVERLFHRSPDTKVIIKAENTREMTIDQERFSDFHGYVQYLVVKDIFEGLNVGVVDAWDMTTAFATNNVHPPEVIIRNQVEMFLTYIC